MKKLSILPFMIFLMSCSTGKWMTSGKGELPAIEEPILTASLFSSDQSVLDDEAINAILSGRIIVPENAKVAIIKFPSAQEQRRARFYYGYLYSQSEEYHNAQERFFDAFKEPLLQSGKVSDVVLLPNLMVPEKTSISILREAAVRTQSDLLLVYRTDSAIYEKYKFLGKDKVKAYCTCEAVLLDIRTGIIPSTHIVTEKYEGQKEKEDMDNLEMRRRAENEATAKALENLGSELASFLDSLP